MNLLIVLETTMTKLKRSLEMLRNHKGVQVLLNFNLRLLILSSLAVLFSATWMSCSPISRDIVFHNYSGQDITLFWDRPEDGYSWSITIPKDRIAQVKLRHVDLAPAEESELKHPYLLYRTIRVEGDEGLKIKQTLPENFSYIWRMDGVSLNHKGKIHIVITETDVIILVWAFPPMEGQIIRNIYEQEDE